LSEEKPIPENVISFYWNIIRDVLTKNGYSEEKTKMPRIKGFLLSRDDYIVQCQEIRRLSWDNCRYEEYGTIPQAAQSMGIHSVILTTEGIIHEIRIREDANDINVTLIHELWYVAEFLIEKRVGSITSFLDEEKISKLLHYDKS